MFNAFTNEKEYDKCEYFERIDLNYWQKTITPLSSFSYTTNSTNKTIAITGLSVFSEFINIAKTYEINGENYTVSTINDTTNTFRECLGLKLAGGLITDAFNNTKLQYIIIGDSVNLFSNFLKNNNQIKYMYLPALSQVANINNIIDTCTAEIVEYGRVVTPIIPGTYNYVATNIDKIIVPQIELVTAKALFYLAGVVDKLDWKYTPMKDYDYKNPVLLDYEIVRAKTNLDAQSPVNLFNTSDIVRIRVISDTKPKYKSVILGGQDLFNRRFVIKDISPLRYQNTQDSGAITMRKKFSYELELQGADV